MQAPITMKQDYYISIYLDTRRKKTNGKYPVKLRVFTTTPRTQKLYPTKFNFTTKEFDRIWNTERPRQEFKDLQRELRALEIKAHDVAAKLNPFTFELFERKLIRKAGVGINLKYHYEQIIEDRLNSKRIGTASSYELSQKSIKGFVEDHLNRSYENLTLYDISPSWLEKYQAYMTDTRGLTLTTVGVYLRALRAIFNKAIDEKEIDRDYYPFGKRKYLLPAPIKVKKALSKEQLKILFKSAPQTEYQQKAKDFWFLSYALSGINTKDLVLLRNKDIQDGKVEFFRAKTRITSKRRLKPVTAYLNDFSSKIIEKYRDKNESPESLVFDIISNKQTPVEQHSGIKNFIRFINQHIKKLSKANGLPEEISTYWARHSFATNVVRNGATMEFIQESLGHKDLSTTQTYFAGFDSETKKKFADTIMDFD